VLVDGRVLSNPRTLVRADAALRVLGERPLRGTVKLAHALDTLAVPVVDRVAVDAGASAGGFTTALLDRGAARVYAVDAGVGQLREGLRHDRRVVNLEGHNLGLLDRVLVPEMVELVTVDLSYLALADALPQLERLHLAPASDLVALVKPTFELRRATLAAGPADVAEATRRVTTAMRHGGWAVRGTCAAPATGRRGAREAFVHARRA